MEPTDLTIQLLQEIRDEQRITRTELAGRIDALAVETRSGREMAAARFEVIEHALRDMAEQLVMVGRAIKVSLESRSVGDRRLEELERRVAELEKQRTPH